MNANPLKKIAVFSACTAAAVVVSAAAVMLTTAQRQRLPVSSPNEATTTAAAPETTTVTTTTTTTTTTVTTTTTTTTATKKKTAQTTAMQPPAALNGQEVVNYAMQFIGTPYVFGGSNLTSGVDCSGFTKSVYAHFGISIPHSSGMQGSAGTMISPDEALPGDLCTTVYDEPLGENGQYKGHAAIYIGNGQVINALPGEGVVITDMYTLYGDYNFYRIFNNTYGQ